MECPSVLSTYQKDLSISTYSYQRSFIMSNGNAMIVQKTNDLLCGGLGNWIIGQFGKIDWWFELW